MVDRPQPAWGNLPFQQAIDFFQAKKLVPTERWSDLVGEGHDTGFMVAGITKADMLADFHQSILKNMAAGIPLKAWTEADFKALCDHYGWEPKQGREWRAKIILEHNIRTAYQAGRYRQMSDPALIKLMPYWMYRHSNSSRVPRPLHVKWNGLILPANDPWFRTHYPPNGWGCKCRVFPITRQELARMGRTEPDTAPNDGHREWTNPSTGKTLLVPNGIDPGWDYCPGATPMARRIERLVVEKIAKLPEPLAQTVKEKLISRKPRPLSLDKALKNGAKIRQELDSQIYPGLREVGREYGYQHEWKRLLQERLEREVGSGTVALRIGGSGELAKLVENASKVMPASWIKASNAQGMVLAKPLTSDSYYGSNRAYYMWRGGDGEIHINSKDTLSTVIHELSHHMQRIMPSLDSIFQAYHRRRTQGEELQSLAKLTGNINFKPHEVAKPDKYLSPYFGKEYIGHGALEMLPMILGVATSVDDALLVRNVMLEDSEIIDLALGVLFGYKP